MSGYPGGSSSGPGLGSPQTPGLGGPAGLSGPAGGSSGFRGGPGSGEMGMEMEMEMEMEMDGGYGGSGGPGRGISGGMSPGSMSQGATGRHEPSWWSSCFHDGIGGSLRFLLSETRAECPKRAGLGQ